MSFGRNHSRLTRRHFDKNAGRITIRYVDPNKKKLTLYGKWDANWIPKIKDYIEVSKDLVKRDRDIKAGWRGHITQIREEDNGKLKYLCTIYNIHQTVFLDRTDFNQYFTKEQRNQNATKKGNNLVQMELFENND